MMLQIRNMMEWTDITDLELRVYGSNPGSLHCMTTMVKVLIMKMALTHKKY